LTDHQIQINYCLLAINYSQIVGNWRIWRTSCFCSSQSHLWVEKNIGNIVCLLYFASEKTAIFFLRWNSSFLRDGSEMEGEVRLMKNSKTFGDNAFYNGSARHFWPTRVKREASVILHFETAIGQIIKLIQNVLFFLALSFIEMG
jgi:hypothetical protein